MYVLFNNFSISCVYSKNLFSLFIFGKQEKMWNEGCLHLDSQLEKVLKNIFLFKYLFITIKKYREGLLKMLLGRASYGRSFDRHFFSPFSNSLVVFQKNNKKFF